MYEGLKGWPKDPNSLTAKQAKEFFAWFLEQKPIRIGILCTYFESSSGLDRGSLDLTDASLEPLWNWFKSVVRWRPITDEDIQESTRLAPERLREVMMEEMKKSSFGPPDTQTAAIMRDLGFYYGEVFVRKYPKILDWELVTKPKSDVNYHLPVVGGFWQNHKGAWNPWNVLSVLTGGVIKGTSRADDTLSGAFRKMEKWVFDE